MTRTLRQRLRCCQTVKFNPKGMVAMTELTKSGDVSSHYGVSTRTLRYYEETGLIQSQRTEGYAYRMYDDANIKKLEQILILRKLGIGIKDIRHIFSTGGSQVVLEVLGKKVIDIDEEVALLHELKEIVIAFIRQIKQADFTNDDHVKTLYDKAKEIETQLEYSGNPSPVHRLFKVAEKLEERAASRLQIPENVMKRLLQNVYFILGDGIEVADELGHRYGIHVYHTCDNRYKHSQNADPKFQPGMFRPEMDYENYFAQDPEDAMRGERAIARDFTPMVIMDLIQLTAVHEKVICENTIDIDSIIPFVTHAVNISNVKAAVAFYDRYESEVRRLDISEEERAKLIRKIEIMREKAKHGIPYETAQYGIKQIAWDDDSTVGQTADIVAEYFGL